MAAEAVISQDARRSPGSGSIRDASLFIYAWTTRYEVRHAGVVGPTSEEVKSTSSDPEGSSDIASPLDTDALNYAWTEIVRSQNRKLAKVSDTQF
jgi:hypothetical protein